MKRVKENPIITCKDVVPSSSEMVVHGVFNAGAVKHNDEFLLLLRIAEGVKTTTENILNIPLLDKDDKLVIKSLDMSKKEYDYSDSRVVYELGTKVTKYLTTISHIRLARSIDGINFTVDEKPLIWPSGKYEKWGVEDPRVVKLDNTYYINYTAVSEHGAATKMQSTIDFKTFVDCGVIFPPENKDVCLVPEKINGQYYCYHRPVPKAFGTPDIWTATSTDLKRWGEHKHFLGVRNKSDWDGGRIGGGAPSIKTKNGWLHIYHASDVNDRYCLGGFLTDLNDPTKLLKITKGPILEPIEKYEIDGFFGNVVFTCGVVENNNELYIYYGAADDKMCLAIISIDDVLEMMEDYNG